MKNIDISTLCMLRQINNNKWKISDLSSSLCLSNSQVEDSLVRLEKSNLLNTTSNPINSKNVRELFIYGVKYFLPVTPGYIKKGILTCHFNMNFFNNLSNSKDVFIWSHPKGKVPGRVITPISRNIPDAVLRQTLDSIFYRLLTYLDALRVGKGEIYAIEHIRELI